MHQSTQKPQGRRLCQCLFIKGPSFYILSALSVALLVVCSVTTVHGFDRHSRTISGQVATFRRLPRGDGDKRRSSPAALLSSAANDKTNLSPYYNSQKTCLDLRGGSAGGIVSALLKTAIQNPILVLRKS